MNGSENPKQKLMYILDILNMETDEDHMLTMPEIKERLAVKGIEAERKSITRDINLLIDLGYDISTFEENRKGYYMRERTFEECELRILIDAVLSSKCITKKKSGELVKKLETLGSRHMADKFWSQICLDERIKCTNEEIYYNIDKINRSISKNSKITFKYYSYDVNKGFVACKEGKNYEINPYALVWHEDFYYLIGMHDKYNDFTHYRVDKMKDIIITKEKRKDISYIPEHRNGFDTAHYMKGVFKMFTGEKDKVEIKFSNSLINAAIDRFGENVTMRKVDDTHFVLATDAYAGEGFVSWIMQFGGKAEVLYPGKLREDIKAKVNELKGIYVEKAM